jgi:hypothetical protein
LGRGTEFYGLPIERIRRQVIRENAVLWRLATTIFIIQLKIALKGRPIDFSLKRLHPNSPLVKDAQYAANEITLSHLTKIRVEARLFSSIG